MMKIDGTDLSTFNAKLLDRIIGTSEILQSRLTPKFSFGNRSYKYEVDPYKKLIVVVEFYGSRSQTNENKSKLMLKISPEIKKIVEENYVYKDYVDLEFEHIPNRIFRSSLVSVNKLYEDNFFSTFEMEFESVEMNARIVETVSGSVLNLNLESTMTTPPLVSFIPTEATAKITFQYENQINEISFSRLELNREVQINSGMMFVIQKRSDGETYGNILDKMDATLGFPLLKPGLNKVTIDSGVTDLKVMYNPRWF